MKSSWSTKKLEELKYAKFFIRWFNEHYHFDYQAEPNENEPPDIYAISRKLPRLNLEIVTSEGEILKDFAQLRKETKRTGRKIMIVKNMPIENWIQNIIEDKEKHYSRSVKGNTILLVCRELGPLFNKEYAKNIFHNLKSSGFKRIFLVHLPGSSKTSSHPHEGQIINIKEIEPS